MVLAAGFVCIFYFQLRGRGRPEQELLDLGSLKPSALAASPRGGGGWRIVWMLHVCEGLNGFWTWEVWRHEHLCDPPLLPSTSGYLSARLTLQHSARGWEEKRSAAEKRKFLKTPHRLSVWGQGVKGQRGGCMSGVKWSRQANGQFGKCLQDNLLTWDQVGTQSVWFYWDHPNRKEIRKRTRCEDTFLTIMCRSYKLNICYCRLLHNAKSELWFCSCMCARCAKTWCGNSWELFSVHALTDFIKSLFEILLASIQSQLCLLANYLMDQRRD